MVIHYGDITVSYMFSYRVIDSWNLLRKEVLSAPSTDSFKRILDTLRNLLEKD